MRLEALRLAMSGFVPSSARGANKVLNDNENQNLPEAPVQGLTSPAVILSNSAAAALISAKLRVPDNW